MLDYFLETFAKKTKEELLGIIASQKVQQKHAVQAAAQLLMEKFSIHVEIEKKNVLKRQYFSYFRTFSNREWTTILSMALLYGSFFMTLWYLRYIEWIGQFHEILMVLGYFLISILSHSFYKKEHKRSNKFWGRIIHSYLLIISAALLITVLRKAISDSGSYMFGENLIYILFGLFFIVFILEVIISTIILLVKLF